ncbi:hypothetical protein [Chryseobacterium sp. 3008163]|uniref:hypothetical protein n=1 Tax=Chryseobacterium sp. 3008163 TaxID=2478663 RepID=UPI000F0C4832|nr:hypothetical protein [Chryseobacterium sp. 3008163]AYM99637.1 hypothetical protein EAG08_04160 [Chryseobacterium sp. 3008163]
MKKLFILFLISISYAFNAQSKSELFNNLNYFTVKEDMLEKIEGGFIYNDNLNLVKYTNKQILGNGTVNFQSLEFNPEDVIQINSNDGSDGFIMADIILNKQIPVEIYYKENGLTKPETQHRYIFTAFFYGTNKDKASNIFKSMTKLFPNSKIKTDLK